MKKEIRVEGLLLDLKSFETLSAREMMQCNALSHMIKRPPLLSPTCFGGLRVLERRFLNLVNVF